MCEAVRTIRNRESLRGGLPPASASKAIHVDDRWTGLPLCAARARAARTYAAITIVLAIAIGANTTVSAC